jgi:predicted transcriptional regulator
LTVLPQSFIAAATSGEKNMSDDTNELNTVELATELTIAWLSNPNTRAVADEVPAFLQKMHEAVSGLSNAAPATGSEAEPAQEHTPAVTARKSLASPNHIISMIDGKPYKTLRRHLSTHGLTPEQYRERYNLKADYPMTAPAYSETRRAMAKKIGLGRKPGATRSKAAKPK